MRFLEGDFAAGSKIEVDVESKKREMIFARATAKATL
jgi:hypothetical protein